jgi:hypothetical protein
MKGRTMTLAVLAASAAVVHRSPGARSWLGSLLIVLGHELIDSCPVIELTEEQRERINERIIAEIDREQARRHRNGDRP